MALAAEAVAVAGLVRTAWRALARFPVITAVDRLLELRRAPVPRLHGQSLERRRFAARIDTRPQLVTRLAAFIEETLSRVCLVRALLLQGRRIATGQATFASLKGDPIVALEARETTSLAFTARRGKRHARLARTLSRRGRIRAREAIRTLKRAALRKLPRRTVSSQTNEGAGWPNADEINGRASDAV